jgi:nucleotide-binding universal stress UspA family protein
LTAPPPEWDPAADAQKILDDTITEVFGGQSGTLSTSVVEGGAARVLLDAGEQADLMVVGSRGHGGFTGLLLGSVSSACAEHATCPVLVVHGQTPPPPA